ncbi:MAG: hypothetical protein HY670_10550 [Chloroflexi bacterium]|nr:hypothetical protein [Chloroflexota bacterium]
MNMDKQILTETVTVLTDAVMVTLDGKQYSISWRHTHTGKKGIMVLSPQGEVNVVDRSDTGHWLIIR